MQFGVVDACESDFCYCEPHAQLPFILSDKITSQWESAWSTSEIFARMASRYWSVGCRRTATLCAGPMSSSVWAFSPSHRNPCYPPMRFRAGFSRHSSKLSTTPDNVFHFSHPQSTDIRNSNGLAYVTTHKASLAGPCGPVARPFFNSSPIRSASHNRHATLARSSLLRRSSASVAVSTARALPNSSETRLFPCLGPSQAAQSVIRQVL